MFSTDNGKDEYEMIVLIDKRHSSKIKEKMTDKTRITLIEIDEEFMTANFPVWRTLAREREIMESKEFQNLIAHRIDHPECCNPLYTIVTHCKIDAVGYVISNELTDAEYIAWVDFGYFNVAKEMPNDFIDPNKLNCSAVNFPLVGPLDEYDKDIMHTLKQAPERIGGYFFFGPRDLLLEYQKEYHKSLHKFQYELNIADDDQHLTLDCVNRRPDLFELYFFGRWHVALEFFSK
jgi:hypothetical protein